MMPDHHNMPTVLVEHKSSDAVSIGYGYVRHDTAFLTEDPQDCSGTGVVSSEIT